MKAFPKKLKSTALVLVFLLLAGMLTLAADSVLSPKSDTMLAFYAEPQDSVDVLFVGGSHSAAAFDPTQLWEEQGFTGYNLYSWGQPAWTTYHYVVEALKTQSPKVVVAEGFGFMYGRSYLAEENFDSVSDDFSLQMNPSLNRAQLAAAMARWQAGGRSAFRYSSILRYHGRWSALTSQDFTWLFTDQYATHKGFGGIYTHEAFAPQQKPQSYPEGTLYEGCEEYLRKLIALSQKEGFELIIATAPYIIEEDAEWGTLDEMRRICEENGVAVLDYNDPALVAETGFSFAEDMAEHAHVNVYGAEKITAHMGGHLAGNYDLADRRGDTGYEYWAEAAETEGREKSQARLRLSPNALFWFAQLDQTDLATFIVVKDGTSKTGDNSLLYEGFAAVGLDTTVLDEGGTLVARIENGGVAYQQAEPIEDTAGSLAVTLNGDGVWLDGELASLPWYDGGVHAVAVDTRTNTVVKAVVFLPEEGCVTRTD